MTGCGGNHGCDELVCWQVKLDACRKHDVLGQNVVASGLLVEDDLNELRNVGCLC